MLAGDSMEKNIKKTEENISEDKIVDKELKKRKESINNDDLRKLLEKNIEISNELLEASKYIKGFIFWRKIISFVQVLIIAIPIILALIYVPPFLESLVELLDRITGVSNFL